MIQRVECSDTLPSLIALTLTLSEPHDLLFTFRCEGVTEKDPLPGKLPRYGVVTIKEILLP